MIKGIFGVNIAVNDLANATENYEKMFGVSAMALDESDFAFPGLSGSQLKIGKFHINLISSDQEETSVTKFLKRNGEGLFLLSVEVDSIAEDVDELRDKGFEVLLDKSISGKFGAVNFMHPRSMNGVQIEVYQPSQT
ncbi:MAG: VOC family protein, partial [Fimbriimonadaceae bacterium]|nr:VOC family protein [Alphaproteobacteria bacterium]